jgi:hypothetical protein
MEAVSLAMTKVVSIKVPDDTAILQSQLTAAAKKAQIPVWELLSKMLEIWNQEERGSSECRGVEALRQAVEDELELSRIERQKLNAKITELEKQVQTAIAESGKLLVLKSSLLVDQVNQGDIKAFERDIEVFEQEYSKLERDRHVLIWQLRKTLGWSRERFDVVVRQLRDSGHFNPVQGAEMGKMTTKQLQSAFVDENGLVHHIITRAAVPTAAPMGEPKPNKALPAGTSETQNRGQRKTSAETFKAILNEANKDEVQAPKRGPGRPRGSGKKKTL